MIDELGYRKRHRHMTIVVDHGRHRVVWAGKGHGAETLRVFFKDLGPERRSIKCSRFALLKNRWNLSRAERCKLSAVQRDNAQLCRGYLLKETLAKALDYLQPKRARDALEAWLAWASRSKLKPFVKAARTIRKYKQRILACIRDRLTNGVVEGFNNRLRSIARRAFGFHSPEPLIAILFLSCGGIELDPPLPGSHV